MGVVGLDGSNCKFDEQPILELGSYARPPTTYAGFVDPILNFRRGDASLLALVVPLWARCICRGAHTHGENTCHCSTMAPQLQPSCMEAARVLVRALSKTQGAPWRMAPDMDTFGFGNERTWSLQQNWHGC